MSFTALKQAEEALAAKHAEIATIVDEAGGLDNMDFSNVKSLTGTNDEKTREFLKLDAEANEIGETRDRLAKVAKAAERAEAIRKAGAPDPTVESEAPTTGTKSVGELFTDSQAFKGMAGSNGPEAELDVELKTLFETTAGFAPETTRTSRVVDYATNPVQLIDYIPSVPTSQAAVVYMEETTYTNAAAEVAEGGAFPEAALEYTEVSSPVRKIAVYLPVTDEQLEDVPGMQGRLNNRLPFMIRQRLSLQAYAGDGTAPNLEGLTQRTGIQTQAKSTDSVPDAIFKAMVKVRTGAYTVPNLVILDPTDWQTVRLAKTTDGVYLWGSPADAGPERMWGVNVLQLHNATAGTGMVLDTMQTELSVKRGITVQVSNSHSDFFIKGKQAIRADMRASLQVYRPAAICTVTGLAS